MAYPDTLVITRPSAGSTDADDVFTAGVPAEIYNDGCDFQDHPEELTRERDAKPGYPQQGVAYLEDESKAKDLQLEDIATVTLGADSTVVEGKVIGVRKLDGRVELGELKWPT